MSNFSDLLHAGENLLGQSYNTVVAGLGGVGGAGAGLVDAGVKLAQGNPGAAGGTFAHDVGLGITAGQAFGVGRTGSQARSVVAATNERFVQGTPNPALKLGARILTAVGPPETGLGAALAIGTSIVAPFAPAAFRAAGRGLGAAADAAVGRAIAPVSGFALATVPVGAGELRAVEGAGSVLADVTERSAEKAAFQESGRGIATTGSRIGTEAVDENLAKNAPRLATEGVADEAGKAGTKSGFRAGIENVGSFVAKNPGKTLLGAAAAGILAIDILNPTSNPHQAGANNPAGSPGGSPAGSPGGASPGGNPSSPDYSTGLLDNLTAGIGSFFERIGAGFESLLGNLGVDVGPGIGKAIAIGGTAVLLAIAVSKGLPALRAGKAAPKAAKAAKAARAARGIRVGA